MNEPDMHSSLFENLLKKGTSILGLQVGIVSKVYGTNYEIIAIDDIANEFKSGDVLQLEDTYCKDIFSQGKTIALTEVDGVQGLAKHPLYAAYTLEAYIGAPIKMNEDIWGTINFSSMVLRPTKFTESEIALVEAYADLITCSLSGSCDYTRYA